MLSNQLKTFKLTKTGVFFATLASTIALVLAVSLYANRDRQAERASMDDIQELVASTKATRDSVAMNYIADRLQEKPMPLKRDLESWSGVLDSMVEFREIDQERLDAVKAIKPVILSLRNR